MNCQLLIALLTSPPDREEALKDDFPLEGSAYDDDEDDDDAWGGDDTAWTEEAEGEDEADGKDESSAYLEFLNEEVWHLKLVGDVVHALTLSRLRNSRIWKTTRTMSWERRVS